MHDFLLSIFLGIVEGLTEFLPVSSTAHLRIVEALCHLDLHDSFWKMYTIVIQLGAILALPVYFWNRIRRKIALTSYAVNAGVPKLYSPFLDYDLYDFLAALPEDPRGIQLKTMKRAYPKYAHLPFEDNDTKKIDVVDYQTKFSREFAAHALLKGGLRSSKLLKQAFQHPG